MGVKGAGIIVRFRGWSGEVLFLQAGGRKGADLIVRCRADKSRG